MSTSVGVLDDLDATPDLATAYSTFQGPLFRDAADAIRTLGDGPLTPTGSVRAALEAGHLLRSGDPAHLDAIERVLRYGEIDRRTQLLVGAGMNGDRFRMPIADPDVPVRAQTWAVEKPAEAQAAQEEFAWKLARELGIDHLLAATVRRTNGSAWIAYHRGESLSKAGITSTGRLDEALTKSYLDDTGLALSPAEAAQAARIDRQLLQLLDYLVANNDRHLTNGVHDAARGAGVTFFDFGHSGRGTAAQGATLLRPNLRYFQAGEAGGRVELDPTVLAYARGRLSPDRIRELHRSVFQAPDIKGPVPHSIGARFLRHVSGPAFREGVVQRLRHALDTGGYEHGMQAIARASQPPLDDGRNVVGFRNVRAHFVAGGLLDRF